MIDDRQLLRLSRNNAATLCFVGGAILIVLTLREIAWHVEVQASMYTVAPAVGPTGISVDWTLVALCAQLAVGAALLVGRNWLARKLIKPSPADTCPTCDYPVQPGVSNCPECGLTLSRGSGASEDQAPEHDAEDAQP